MKKVFSDISKIAHLWANQLQEDARNSGGNFFFNGHTIYSYGHHFPIAKHIENAQGEKAILFTERSYSVTTSKHITVVRQAVNHRNIIYCHNPHSTHADNFKAWQNECESVASNLPKAKKPEKYLSQISGIGNHVAIYVQFFGLEIPETLKAALNIGSKDEYTQYVGKKEEYQKAEEKKAAELLKKRHKKELSDWLKGKTHRLYTRNGQDYLRVTGDNIETTQAVKLPFAYGKKLFERIKTGSLKKGDKVLDYHVSEVSDKIVIGCHTFPVKYIIEFGNKTFK